MIQPVNNHLVIEPIAHDGFMASQNDTYQEIGVVIAFAEELKGTLIDSNEVGLVKLKRGDKVFFDSWLAAKYPKEGSTTGEFYWLVKWSDVRAVEVVA